MPDRNVIVHWYSCDCDYLSKYCEDNHRQVASVPEYVLTPYIVASS